MTTTTESPHMILGDGASARGDGKTPPASGFNENHFYKVRVTRQLLSIDQKGVTYLSVYGRILGMLCDTRNPNSGLLSAPDTEVEVRLRFDSQRPDTMEYSIKDLANLGFTDEDLSRLDPDHEKHVSFVGKEAFVAPKYRQAGDYTNCYWNFRFPRDLSAVKSVGSAAVRSSAAADVFKVVMRTVRKDADSLPAVANDVATLADVKAAKATKRKAATADTPFG